MRPVVWLEATEAGWEAFRYALEMARARGVGLLVVCGPGVAPEASERAVAEGAQQGVAVEVRCVEPGGRVELEVCRAGEEEGAEVVVAAHRTATRKVVLGEAITWLLVNAPGPVVVYRSPREP
ncbi:hypothetical protein HRbin32_00206 [bacterium HR32]|nr:hypothetical protein HRbin32_00206 [bacterium HR32]